MELEPNTNPPTAAPYTSCSSPRIAEARKKAMEAAAAGELGPIKELCDIDFADFRHGILRKAAQHGKVHIIIYLSERGHLPGVEALHISARAGQTLALRHMTNMGLRRLWSSSLLLDGVQSGELSTVQYLIDNGCPSDSRACAAAAAAGNMELFRSLTDKGVRFDSEAAAQAALHGHSAIFRYLHENKCPLPANLVDKVASGGSIELMDFIRGAGFQADKGTCETALLNGHDDLFRHLAETGCPWDEEECFTAATRGSAPIYRVMKLFAELQAKSEGEGKE